MIIYEEYLSTTALENRALPPNSAKNRLLLISSMSEGRAVHREPGWSEKPKKATADIFRCLFLFLFFLGSLGESTAP